MAYTYEDFTNAATSAGMLDRFSQYDLDTATKNPEYGMSLLGLLQDANNASSAEQQLIANEAANQLRKSYGVYSTGDSDSGYSYANSYSSNISDLMNQINNYGSFDYSNQEAYQQLLDSIANREAFSYDLDSDPTYSAYKKQYLREGERASANALAQAASASGGQVSSYAQTAASQAGNYYAAALTDMIPTLQQNAYSQYLDEYNNNLSALSALQTDRSFDYDEWANQYNMLQNSLSNYQTQDETDYQRYLDQINATYQQEQQAYENALALYQLLGYATPEVAAILGIDSDTAANTSTGSGTSGSGSGSGTSDSSSSGTTGATVSAAAGAAVGLQNGVAVDEQSVLALGYGPITEEQLYALVQSGQVREYVENGIIKFARVSSTNTSTAPNPTTRTGAESIRTANYIV